MKLEQDAVPVRTLPIPNKFAPVTLLLLERPCKHMQSCYMHNGYQHNKSAMMSCEIDIHKGVWTDLCCCSPVAQHCPTVLCLGHRVARCREHSTDEQYAKTDDTLDSVNVITKT